MNETSTANEQLLSMNAVSHPRMVLQELRKMHPKRDWRKRFDETWGDVIEWRGKNAAKYGKWFRWKP